MTVDQLIEALRLQSAAGFGGVECAIVVSSGGSHGDPGWAEFKPIKSADMQTYTTGARVDGAMVYISTPYFVLSK